MHKKQFKKGDRVIEIYRSDPNGQACEKIGNLNCHRNEMLTIASSASAAAIQILPTR